jgi:hypothetical protein
MLVESLEAGIMYSSNRVIQEATVNNRERS